jgi:hypothetical protein
MAKQKGTRTQKVLLMFIIPFILGLIFFWPYSQDLAFDKDNQIIKIPAYADLIGSGPKSILIHIFGVPFDLRNYIITIKDVSNYEGDVGDIGYYIDLDNRNLSFLKAGGVINAKVLAGKDYPAKINVVVKQGNAPSGSTVKWTLDFHVSIRPTFSDSFTQLLIFLIAWNTLIMLWKNIMDLQVNKKSKIITIKLFKNKKLRLPLLWYHFDSSQ